MAWAGRSYIYIAFLAVSLSAEVGADDKPYRVKLDVFACQHEETVGKVRTFLGQKDFDAVRAAINNDDLCIMLKKDDRVFLDDFSLLRGDALVHRKGEAQEFWTITNALDLSTGGEKPKVKSRERESESELRARLAQAIQDGDGFDDSAAADVWFADMSVRLQLSHPKAFADVSERLEFLRLVHAEASKAGISPELVLAVIDVESGFDRVAISRSGAFGYMKIMPFWLAKIGRPGDNLFQTRINLRMGCTILRYYLDMEHGNYVHALARYDDSYGKVNFPYSVLMLLNKRWSPS